MMVLNVEVINFFKSAEVSTMQQLMAGECHHSNFYHEKVFISLSNYTPDFFCLC